jgi:hypothetical protein
MTLPRLRRGLLKPARQKIVISGKPATVTLTSFWIGSAGVLTKFHEFIFFTLCLIDRDRTARLHHLAARKTPTSIGPQMTNTGRRILRMTCSVYGARLTGPHRREHRAHHTQPNLAAILHVSRLGTNGGEGRAHHAQPNLAVVLNVARRNFRGADFFHDSLQVWPTFSPGRAAGIQDIVVSSLIRLGIDVGL